MAQQADVLVMAAWNGAQIALQRTVRPTAAVAGVVTAHARLLEAIAGLRPRDEDGQITLVDQNHVMLFTSMLTEGAGGEVDVDRVVSAVRRLSPRVTFMQGRVDGIDPATKRVTLTHGDTEDAVPKEQRTLEADHLVNALGLVTNFHGVSEVDEHALTVKSVGDAAAIRNRALALLEYARLHTRAPPQRVAGAGVHHPPIAALLSTTTRTSCWMSMPLCRCAGIVALPSFWRHRSDLACRRSVSCDHRRGRERVYAVRG